MSKENRTTQPTTVSPARTFQPCHTPAITFTTSIPCASRMTVGPLPAFLQDILSANTHVVPGDYSVTELLDAPRCVLLRRLHPGVDEQTPASQVPRLAGTALHSYLAARLPAAFTTEELLLHRIDSLDASLSGTVDAYSIAKDGTCTILDFKHRKANAWTYRRFEDVVWQLNLSDGGRTRTLPGLLPGGVQVQHVSGLARTEQARAAGRRTGHAGEERVGPGCR